MSRLPPWILVTAVWAAIYLPALGSFEIKGEEGRRILPAIAMIESGNYLVPQVGSDTYFRKPPLINWLVAGSFNLFHARNEWAARVPSVLCILIVAIAFLTVARDNLGRMGSTIAGLVWLTCLGTLEKGRLIEIEALYISLCGLAVIFWLSFWLQKRSPWLTWTIPWIFLGLGLLAKGPTLLIFFYAFIIAVLWHSRQLQLLIHPAHVVGILLMLGIVGAWAIPFLQMNQSGKVAAKWSNQFTGRVTGEFFRFYVWILTIPRAIGYFLPWLLFVPFLRFDHFADEHDRSLGRALAWGAAGPLLIISLIPGAAPRYSLPVLTPFCWLMGMALAENAFAQPDWLRTGGVALWKRFGVPFVCIAVAFGLIGYPLLSIYMKRHEKVRSVAAQINEVVPKTETLYAVNPNYQPLFFYIQAPVKYVSRVPDLPNDTRYFLVRPDREEMATATNQFAPRHPQRVLKVKDYRNQVVIVFKVSDS